MMVRDGNYYYAPHRSVWGIWKAGITKNGVRMDDFVKDVPTKYQARKEVYSLNGWIQPT